MDAYENTHFDEGVIRAIRTSLILGVGIIVGSFLNIIITLFGGGVLRVEIPHIVFGSLSIVNGIVILVWAFYIEWKPLQKAKAVVSLPWLILVLGSIVFVYSLYRIVQVFYCISNFFSRSSFCEESLIWELSGMFVGIVIGVAHIVVIGIVLNVRKTIFSAVRHPKRKKNRRGNALRTLGKKNDNEETGHSVLLPQRGVLQRTNNA